MHTSLMSVVCPHTGFFVFPFGTLGNVMTPVDATGSITSSRETWVSRACNWGDGKKEEERKKKITIIITFTM